ncbi:MAG: thioesterase [Coprobacillus sp.]
MKDLMSYETRKIEGYELDFMQEYQLCHLFNCFSKIAALNAKKIGYYNESLRGHYGWVVAKQTLHLERPINIHDELELSTIVGKNSFVTYPRYYFIHAMSKQIGYCSSVWTLIDMKSRRITSPKKIGLAELEVNHEMTLPAPQNIKIDIEMNLVSQRTVLYSDVDTNMHMNNTRYIQWALDLIDFDIHKKFFVSDLTVQYKKEIRPSKNVSLYLGHEKNRYIVEGRSHEDEVYFTIEIYFKER